MLVYSKMFIFLAKKILKTSFWLMCIVSWLSAIFTKILFQAVFTVKNPLTVCKKSENTNEPIRNSPMRYLVRAKLSLQKGKQVPLIVAIRDVKLATTLKRLTL